MKNCDENSQFFFYIFFNIVIMTKNDSHIDFYYGIITATSLMSEGDKKE